MKQILMVSLISSALVLGACAAKKSGDDSAAPGASIPKNDPNTKIGAGSSEIPVDGFSCHILPKDSSVQDRTAYCVDIPKSPDSINKLALFQQECMNRIKDAPTMKSGWHDAACPKLNRAKGYCVGRKAKKLKTYFYYTSTAKAREKCVSQEEADFYEL